MYHGLLKVGRGVIIYHGLLKVGRGVIMYRGLLKVGRGVFLKQGDKLGRIVQRQSYGHLGQKWTQLYILVHAKCRIMKMLHFTMYT